MMKRSTLLIGLLTILLFGASAVSIEAQSDEIWQLHITITTGNVSNAGTDDDISVSLNRGNLTWLDYGRDDFERNQTNRYDLLQNGNIHTLRDITRIQIAKNGSDGWCIKSFTLDVNEYTYNASFNSCHWLDNDNGHTRQYVVNNPSFAFYGIVPVLVPYMERSEVESLLESAIGHSIQSSRLYWDNDDRHVVEVWQTNRDTLHVDLDLQYALNNSSDPSVDVDYDIRFECNGRTLEVSVENVVVDVGFSIGTSTVIITNDPLIAFSAQRLRDSIASRIDTRCRVSVLEGGTIYLR